MKNFVTIDELLCKGCGLCVAACPKKIMILNREKLNPKGYNPSMVSEPEICIGCAMCATMCPESAIVVEREV
ncbi:MAG: 4Fe-4S binding protein [Lachnospiraceae bacterium]|jgi:2-oxoglutarate ferredoxin oxidoreductase subunit delta|nr:4Fe-4S binding protein [Lachnospiraceae bacterium]